MIVALIILAALVIIAFAFVAYGVTVYNKLVTLRERTKNAFSQIEVQLKRRYDLIPNLVETAKGYLAHEKDTLTAVIEARARAMSGLGAASQGPGDPAAMAQLGQAEAMLSSALSRLSVVVERYPELKASETMNRLTEELTHTENKVAFARQAFNDSVTAYNTFKHTFPPVVVANMSGHAQDAALLEFADSAAIQEAPQVSFGS